MPEVAGWTAAHLGEFDEPAQRTRQSHLIGRATVEVQERAIIDRVREALRARDRHVQSVARDKELAIP
jgi:hypothetical protein